MKQITCMILDDEKSAVDVLSAQIARFFPSISVVATATDPHVAEQVLKTTNPDLLFLDIEMPNMNGLEFLRLFADRSFEVIFVTAYDQHAVDAFKENAIGYILKPIDRVDFVRTVTTALIRVTSNQTSQLEAILSAEVLPKKEKKKVAVPYKGDYKLLAYEDVVFLQADGSYAKIQTTKELHVVSKNLKTIAQSMEGWNLLKVNRSFVVNPHHISGISKKGGGEIIMSSGMTISVGAKIKDQVFDQISESLTIL